MNPRRTRTDSGNAEMEIDATMNSEEINKKPERKEDELLAPDGGWGWVVCLASAACNFLITGINTATGILLVGMLHTFHESVTKTSLVFAPMNGLTMMVGPLVSAFLHFCSHRQMIIVGSLIAAASLLVSVFVPTINALIFTFGVIGGISMGMIFFAANVIVSLYFTTKRGLAVGIANAGAGIGTFLMNFGIEKLLRYYALRGTLLLLSGFVLNLVVFGALCRPLKYRKIIPKQQNGLVPQQNEETNLYGKASAEQNDDDEKEDMLKTHETESFSKKAISSNTNGRCMVLCKYIWIILDVSVLKNADTIILLIIFFLWSANQVVMTYLPLYSINIGLSTADGAIMMAIVGIGCTIGELLIGVLIDIFHFKSDHLMTLSIIVMGLTTIAIPSLYDIYSLGATILVWSIAVGFGIPLRVLLVVELMGIENLSPVFSFIMFSNGFGYGVLPPIFGWLYDVTESFYLIFTLTAAFFFVSLIFTLIINYQMRKRASHHVGEATKKVSDA